MKVVIQVVDEASVTINNEVFNEIDNGYLLLIGIDQNDDENTLTKMAAKIANLRINADENGKTNLSILQTKGKILSISQFTLCASLESRRPSFCKAAKPDIAKHYYEVFNEKLREYDIVVKEGIFGEDMIVSLKNHGPFTIVLTEKDI